MKNLWQQDITFKERTKAGMKTAGMIGITAWLYYRRVWAAIFLILPGIWLYREFLEEESKKKEQEFQKQFREMIQTLSSALNTGYSVENAFYETQKELKIQYPEEARISRELLLITRKLRMHIPVEQVLEEFAERVPSEDVKSFVTVFVTAKKSGGDMIGIIRNTTSQIGDKIEVKREIDTLLAAKKYEFQIMSMVPYGIIAYMSLSFSDFMEELYGNVTGIGVMTLCLGIYVGAYYLGVAVFFGWAYMKTNNIWLCVLIHGVNNAAVAAFDSDLVTVADTVESVSVFDGIMTAVAVIVMLLFLFTKEYRKGERV